MQMWMVLLLIIASVGMIAYALMPAKKDEKESVARRMSGKKAVDELGRIKKEAKDSAAKRFMNLVSPMAVKPVMPKSSEELSALRIKLGNAGFRQEGVTTIFLASKTVLAIVAVIVGLVYCLGGGETMARSVGLSMFFGAVGFWLPNLWLRLAISGRSEKVRNGLADVLDLMVISVEAGLGLDAALQRVGDEMRHVHPILSEELQLTSMEAQMGVPRTEALQNFAIRTGVPEVRALVAVVAQAEKFGTSVARALRNQADSLRVKRRLAAEERAQKTTVKLMLPLVLFIFPAIFVVLAGPAVLNMMETFGNQ